MSPEKKAREQRDCLVALAKKMGKREAVAGWTEPSGLELVASARGLEKTRRNVWDRPTELLQRRQVAGQSCRRSVDLASRAATRLSSLPLPSPQVVVQVHSLV